MNKDYGLQFGSGDPRSFTGLSPTMVLFYVLSSGQTLAPPSISEPLAGSGIYYFSYGTTQAVFFLSDGGAALAAGDRYVDGVLDPIQAVDQKIGTINDSIGSTSVDPTTVMGFIKRNQEFDEGDAYFDKSTATWSIYNRGSNGATTLLRVKDLTNTITAAAKSGV